MDSLILLDKIRKLSGLIHSASESDRIDTRALCLEVSSFLECDVCIIDSDGKVTSHSIRENSITAREIGDTDGEYIKPEVNERFLGILSTKENILPEMLGITRENADTYYACVVPVYAYGDRIGTIFLFNREKGYGIDDTIICEYIADVIGIETVRQKARDKSESEWKKNEVQAAVRSLTGTETEAAVAVFGEMKGLEGVLVASRVSERTGIGRSVIINTLRKFESAGVIESKSAGMKGTYIKVKNEFLAEELTNLRKRL